jgi:type VI secretion system FHA domain protein
MPLVLNLTARDPALLNGAVRRVEVKGRMTIGRGGDNDLVLADPDRQLSKNHCVIQFDGRDYALTDTSTNGVFLNDSPERLMRDVPVALVEGCLIRLGAYEMAVVAIAPSVDAAPAGGGFSGGGFGDYPPRDYGRGAAAPGGGLFDDPFGPAPIGGSADDPFGFEPVAQSRPGNAGLSPGAGLADDPFGFGAPMQSGSPFGATIPADDDLFGPAPAPDPWLGQTQHDHAPSVQQGFVPPKRSVEAIPDDWDLSDLGVELNPTAPKFSPPPDPEFAPPVRQPATPPRRPPLQAAPPQGTSRASAGGAAQTLMAAAGLPDGAVSASESERVMQVAGEMLLATAKGLMEILAARANTKQEFRIERTMIGAARNNPLKVSDTPEDALRIMLQAQTPGFIAGRKALEEALDDIKTHQLAVLAGMQVALTTVIARFDPAKLEKRIEQSSMIESILPAARKARYWELFKALYKEIAGELEDDFQKAFGAEFARAYREQIDRF